MKLAHYFPFFIITIIFSCTKPPDYPIEPVIKFERLSRNSMEQGFTNNDSIVVTISFTDGDGDLGNTDSTIDIFVKDTREEVIDADPSPFKMPFVPIQGVGNGISGEIAILNYTTCCLYPGGVYSACDQTEPAILDFPTDTLIYEIYIVDRAGHESNRVLTDPVILQCRVN
jgi:hypothetical protein